MELRAERHFYRLLANRVPLSMSALALCAVVTTGCTAKIEESYVSSPTVDATSKSPAPSPTPSTAESEPLPTSTDLFIGLPTDRGLCRLLLNGTAGKYAPAVTGGHECLYVSGDPENTVRMGTAVIGSFANKFEGYDCPLRRNYKKSIICLDQTFGRLTVWGNGKKTGVGVGMTFMYGSKPNADNAFAFGRGIADNL